MQNLKDKKNTLIKTLTNIVDILVMDRGGDDRVSVKGKWKITIFIYLKKKLRALCETDKKLQYEHTI